MSFSGEVLFWQIFRSMQQSKSRAPFNAEVPQSNHHIGRASHTSFVAASYSLLTFVEKSHAKITAFGRFDICHLARRHRRIRSRRFMP